MSDEKRTKVANHDYLNANGEVVKDEEMAAGIRYEHIPTGFVLERQVVPASEVGTGHGMLAIFGAKTYATNLASQWKSQGEDISLGDFMAGRFDSILVDGKWPAKSGGGGGRALDLDILVEAMGAVYKKNKKPFDPAVALQRVTEDVDFRKAAYAKNAIKAKYLELKGGGVDDLDDLG